MAEKKTTVRLCDENAGFDVDQTKVNLSITTSDSLSSQERQELEGAIIAAIQRLGYNTSWIPLF